MIPQGFIILHKISPWCKHKEFDPMEILIRVNDIETVVKNSFIEDEGIIIAKNLTLICTHNSSYTYVQESFEEIQKLINEVQSHSPLFGVS